MIVRKFLLLAVLVGLAMLPGSAAQSQDGESGRLSNAPLRLEQVHLGTKDATDGGLVRDGAEQADYRQPAIFQHLRSEESQSQAEAHSALLSEIVGEGPEAWIGRSGVGGTLQLILMVSVLSLAPAILLMTTCYVRVVVVLGLLRQALGTGQLPPTQVMTSISIFITFFVMSPVWSRVYSESIQPYTAEGSTMTHEEAWQAAVGPIRGFMSDQIDLLENQDDVHLFHNYYTGGGTPASSYEEVPTQVLLPAFMLSELKTAFLMGFMIYLPFLIIDLVVAAVTVSMGMMMLPPTMISLPFKLLLFVLVDGWHLVIGMLLHSFGPLG